MLIGDQLSVSALKVEPKPHVSSSEVMFRSLFAIERSSKKEEDYIKEKFSKQAEAKRNCLSGSIKGSRPLCGHARSGTRSRRARRPC